jgi:hypothetical protein
MIERRQHKRVEVNFWASLKHPLLGTATGEIREMSISGLSLTLDEEMGFFIMMELDVRIHGEGWDDSMPSLPVQVVRVNQREVALRFLDSNEDSWVPPFIDELGLDLPDFEGGMGDELEGFTVRA